MSLFKFCCLRSEVDEDNFSVLQSSERSAILSRNALSPFSLGWEELGKNPYNELTNPDGIINLAMAENRLSLDLIQEWIDSHPESSSLPIGRIDKLVSLTAYREYHGIPELRNSMAGFMEMVTKSSVKLNPDNLVITSGASAAVELLTFCITDPGDAIITIAPSYAGFDRDVEWRSQVKLVPAITSSKNNFLPDESCLETSWNLAVSKSLRPRAILFTNPCNPGGFSYSKTILAMILRFAKSKNIHVISDEIYAGCVFDDPPFVSIVTVAVELGDDLSGIHIIYGLSKDLGLPGFRVGVVCSWNQTVLDAAVKLSRVTSVPNHTQLFLAALLSDVSFMESYLLESPLRLKEARNFVDSALERIGLRAVEGNAGQFVFVNLSPLLETHDESGEVGLYKRIVYDAGLNLNPGVDNHIIERGWYRLCFGMVPKNELQLAMIRLGKLVGDRSIAPNM